MSKALQMSASNGHKWESWMFKGNCCNWNAIKCDSPFPNSNTTRGLELHTALETFFSGLFYTSPNGRNWGTTQNRNPNSWTLRPVISVISLQDKNYILTFYLYVTFPWHLNISETESSEKFSAPSTRERIWDGVIAGVWGYCLRQNMFLEYGPWAMHLGNISYYVPFLEGLNPL